ncbi:hypothetical protein CB1_001390014 [Camelus ferus]|nr:hypothetical protein CB1_001390014 [Camelus ferus]
MGVPKFYRWISERYPCLSEVVKEHQIPEFDNLYLDMNGIIHQCSHPNDDDVHFRISDDKIFTDIFHYLEVLFRIIKPRKVFFMAVDGYINESGHLNLPRFEKYLVKLSDFDREHFSEVFVDLKWFESKVGNKYLNEAAGVAAEEAKNYKEKKKSKHLMTSEDSPIIEYYPPDFKTDLNGKQQEWEAVVLIPFIDEKRLLEAMETCNHSLKKEERKRNQHSECLMCWYDSDTEFIYPSPWPEKFPAIEQCCARAPELFCYIAKNSQEDVFYEDDIWPGENENGAEKVQEIITWLKGHPVSTLSRSSCDLQILDAAIVEKIEEEVEKCKQRKTNKKVRVTVKPHLLYRPLEQQHGVIPDRDAEFRLFDRVVNVPTKDDDEFCNIWQSLQGSRKAQHFQPTLQEKTFGGPAKCNIKLLKRSESAEVSENQNVVTGYPNTIDKPNPGIENFIASLNISKENEVQSSHYEEPPSEEHLSPQSFAMKGTRMLKEILKIDSSNTVDHKNEMKQFGNEVTVSSNRRDEYGPSSQPKQNKKLTSYTNKPHCASEYHNVQSMDSVCWPASSQIPPVSTPVTELSRICSLVGMPQPNFSFLRTAQTMTVCQVKLSNGLLVHGPQCHSENEAKEKAAFFALQQLGSLGVNFPLPPPIFPSYPPAIPPGTIPPVFPQPTGKGSTKSFINEENFKEAIMVESFPKSVQVFPFPVQTSGATTALRQLFAAPG